DRLARTLRLHRQSKQRRTGRVELLRKQPISNTPQGSTEPWTTSSGNRRKSLVIFASGSRTQLNQQPRRRKYAFSTRAMPYTSAFIAMTLCPLGSSRPNSGGTRLRGGCSLPRGSQASEPVLRYCF